MLHKSTVNDNGIIHCLYTRLVVVVLLVVVGVDRIGIRSLLPSSLSYRDVHCSLFALLFPNLFILQGNPRFRYFLYCSQVLYCTGISLVYFLGISSKCKTSQVNETCIFSPSKKKNHKRNLTHKMLLVRVSANQHKYQQTHIQRAQTAPSLNISNLKFVKVLGTCHQYFTLIL